jgi:hypothetical protein
MSMSGEICTDNRFEIIAAYKKKLIEGTNIQTSPEEMAVIDNILFRFWQMRWLPPIPHGRLIDADAMLMRINHAGMEAYMDGVCYGVHPSQEYLDLLGEIIDDAPTIIPAEGGE